MDAFTAGQQKNALLRVGKRRAQCTDQGGRPGRRAAFVHGKKVDTSAARSKRLAEPFTPLGAAHHEHATQWRTTGVEERKQCFGVLLRRSRGRVHEAMFGNEAGLSQGLRAGSPHCGGNSVGGPLELASLRLVWPVSG